MRWRFPVGFAIEWRTWGDESVVFHPLSGDTHLLNLVESTAVRALESQGPSSLDELTDCVARRLGSADCDLLRRYLEKALPQLDELGIVERV